MVGKLSSAARMPLPGATRARATAAKALGVGVGPETGVFAINGRIEERKVARVH
jgi:hypothetical protein